MQSFLRTALWFFILVIVTVCALSLLFYDAPVLPASAGVTAPGQEEVYFPAVKTQQPLHYALEIKNMANGEVLGHVYNMEQAETFLSLLLQSAQDVPARDEAIQSISLREQVLIDYVLIDHTPLSGEAAFARLTEQGSLPQIDVYALHTEEEPVDFQTVSDEDDRLPLGARLIKTLGKEGVKKTVTRRTYQNGKLTAVDSVFDGIAAASTDQLVSLGTYQADEAGRYEGEKVPDGSALPPLDYPIGDKHDVIAYYGMTDGVMHYGLDIAGGAGSVVSAAGAGKVIYCKNRGSYGGTVEIDHGKGVVTRIGGLSDIRVGLGQEVERGEAIGLLAQSEPTLEEPEPQAHVHVELLIDGIPCNPRYYLG